MDRVRQFLKDEEAPTAVEYAIMLGGIAAVIIATVGLLGSNVNSFFSAVAERLAR